jgi:hypothetical protein
MDLTLFFGDRVSQDLELTIQPSVTLNSQFSDFILLSCWYYRHVPPCLAWTGIFFKRMIPFRLSKKVDQY